MPLRVQNKHSWSVLLLLLTLTLLIVFFKREGIVSTKKRSKAVSAAFIVRSTASCAKLSSVLESQGGIDVFLVEENPCLGKSSAFTSDTHVAMSFVFDKGWLPQVKGLGKNLNCFWSEGLANSTADGDIISSFDYILVDSVFQQARLLELYSSFVQDLMISGRLYPSIVVLNPTQKDFPERLAMLTNRGLASARFKRWASQTLPIYRRHSPTIQTNSPRNKYAAVIIETSANFLLEFACRNALYYLGPSWSLVVYHSHSNSAIVKYSLRALPVEFRLLPTSLADVGEYNTLMKTLWFWDSLSSFSKVLLFQTDSILLSRHIDEFLAYDYIGAPWDFSTNDRVRKAIQNGTMSSTVGNGGFSLRSVAAMRKVVEKFGHESTAEEQEDMFFARFMDKAGYTLAPENVAARFCMEVDTGALSKKEQPLALHAAWYYMPPKKYMPMLQKSIPRVPPQTTPSLCALLLGGC